MPGGEPSDDEVIDGGDAAATPIPEHEGEAGELRAELALRDTAHRLAIERLRAGLLASDPAIAPELVSGDSVEAIETSFATAKAMADRLRDQLRRDQAAAIPGGTIHRSPAPPKTPLEKIRAGLAGG